MKILEAREAVIDKRNPNKFRIDMNQFSQYANSKSYRRGEWFVKAIALHTGQMSNSRIACETLFYSVNNEQISATSAKRVSEQNHSEDAPRAYEWRWWAAESVGNSVSYEVWGHIPAGQQAFLELDANYTTLGSAQSFNYVTNQSIEPLTQDLRIWIVIFRYSDLELSEMTITDTGAWTGFGTGWRTPYVANYPTWLRTFNASESEKNFIDKECLLDINQVGYGYNYANYIGAVNGGSNNDFYGIGAQACSAKLLTFCYWDKQQSTLSFQDYVCERSHSYILYQDDTVAILDSAYFTDNTKMAERQQHNNQWRSAPVVAAVKSTQATNSYYMSTLSYYDTSTNIGDILHAYSKPPYVVYIKQNTSWQDSLSRMKAVNPPYRVIMTGVSDTSNGMLNPYLPLASINVDALPKHGIVILEMSSERLGNALKVEYRFSEASKALIVLKAEGRHGVTLLSFYVEDIKKYNHVTLPCAYTGNVYVAVEVVA